MKTAQEIQERIEFLKHAIDWRIDGLENIKAENTWRAERTIESGEDVAKVHYRDTTTEEREIEYQKMRLEALEWVLEEAE